MPAGPIVAMHLHLRHPKSLHCAWLGGNELPDHRRYPTDSILDSAMPAEQQKLRRDSAARSYRLENVR